MVLSNSIFKTLIRWKCLAIQCSDLEFLLRWKRYLRRIKRQGGEWNGDVKKLITLFSYTFVSICVCLQNNNKVKKNFAIKMITLFSSVITLIIHTRNTTSLCIIMIMTTLENKYFLLLASRCIYDYVSLSSGECSHVGVFRNVELFFFENSPWNIYLMSFSFLPLRYNFCVKWNDVCETKFPWKALSDKARRFMISQLKRWEILKKHVVKFNKLRITFLSHI